MIEPIMYMGIGFLVAGLLLVGFIPMVHVRAVGLTRRRLEAMTPTSMAEIQAGGDRLRAEFAMSTRRLEMAVERMTAKSATQLAEIGKKSDAIRRLRLELDSNSATVIMLEAKTKALGCELASTRTSLQVAERMLADTSAALDKVTSDFNKSSTTSDCQRVELVALRAQSEELKGQIESYEKETRDLQSRLEVETADGAAAKHELSEERCLTDALRARVAERDRQLVVQSIDAEILTRRVQELVARLEEEKHEQQRVPAEDQISARTLVFDKGGWSVQTLPALRVGP